MSHNRIDRHFTLGGLIQHHSLDDIQARLIQDTEDCLNELWPNSQRPPAHLSALFDSVCLLLDWTSRTDRGRARLRRRYLDILAINAQDLKGCDSNLLRSVIAADDTEEAAVGCDVIADAVEAWLAAGDD